MLTRITAHLRRLGICLALLMFLTSSACAAGGSAGGASPSHTPAPAPARQRPLSGPLTYVALGASDAVGVGSNQPGSQGYVPLIATHLPRGSHLVNLGISGIRLHQALTQELPVALATAPNLVTIWLVANDFVGQVSYDDYMHDLDSLLARLRAQTHAAAYMADLPDLTRLPAFAGLTPAQKAGLRQRILRWNAGIDGLAVRYGITLVDLYSHGSQLTAHPEFISGDGFHPSSAGYVQLADIFWQAIQSGHPVPEQAA
jgi:acyl-CoA thioesterase I